MHPRRPTASSARNRSVLAVLALAGLLVSGCSLVSVSTPLAELLPPPSPTPAAESVAGPRDGPDASPRVRRAALKPYTLDLYRKDDHVPQYDGSWCVGALMQMMINMIEPGRADRTRATQQRLYKFARKVSPWVETRPGASVYGWSEGLEQLGYGPYEELAASTRQAALKLAAKQMRLTNKPVGLLVWEGAHAWVMSGFKATADPRLTDDFTVTHVWVEDPWTGRVSGAYGAGLAPHTLLTVKALGADFLKYSSMHRPQYGDDGMFVVVAPLEETALPA
jgi:hypothetical protein